MSWQSYVDKQICELVKCKSVVIAGLTDGAVWARYEDAPENAITPAEVKVIAETMRTNPSAFQASGIHVGGEKFFFINSDDKVVRGRKATNALIVVATITTVMVAVTADGVPPGTLNTVVEKLADYLRGQNY